MKIQNDMHSKEIIVPSKMKIFIEHLKEDHLKKLQVISQQQKLPAKA